MKELWTIAGRWHVGGGVHVFLYETIMMMSVVKKVVLKNKNKGVEPRLKCLKPNGSNKKKSEGGRELE